MNINISEVVSIKGADNSLYSDCMWDPITEHINMLESSDNCIDVSILEVSTSIENSNATDIKESVKGTKNKNNELERIKYRTILSLKDKSHEEVLRFFMALGLIATRCLCPVCGKLMRIKKRIKMSDGFTWSCKGGSKEEKHSKIESVRKGSIFFLSKLKLEDILMIIHCWLYKVPYEWMLLEFSPSGRTLAYWTNFCRNICLKICSMDDTKIGGEGQIVEIVRKRCENLKLGKMEMACMYVGVENIITDKYFFRIFENCNKSSFLEVIKSCVLPGTIIVSELCSAYNCLEDEDFVNLEATCRLKFEDPENYLDLKGKSWNVIKKKLPRGRSLSRAEDEFDNFLAEYVWRKKNANAYDKMRCFISAINIVYPVATEEDVKQLQEKYQI